MLGYKNKLRAFFANDDGFDNLRTLVVGRDDLSFIPHNSPAYLTRLTRKNLGSFPLLDRVIPESSVFSPPSAPDIPEFVVGSNLKATRANAAPCLCQSPA